MKDVIRQFQERQNEVNKYFSLLEDVMLKDAKLIFPNNNISDFDIDLRQILRANAFLLLYNLVESSMSQAIEAIHLHVENSGLKYDNLNTNLKKEFVKFIQKGINIDKFVSNVSNIADDILKYYPEKRKVFSGNIDAKEIRDTGKKYGFSCETDKEVTKDGFKLLALKSNRNHLAHGYISFKECGKEHSLSDLLEMKVEIFEYISQILDNIELYLKNKEYISQVA
jgi:hypothetical protein